MNFSFTQILILILLGFLFFSDTSYIIKNFKTFITKLKQKNIPKTQKYHNNKKKKI